MMAWNVVYLEQVEDWLKGLTNHQLKSLAKEIRFLELCGNQLKLPHSKAIGAGLFELRERNYGLRIYYSFDRGEVIVLLLAGNKKSQKNDIKKAKELLQRYKEEAYCYES